MVFMVDILLLSGNLVASRPAVLGAGSFRPGAAELRPGLVAWLENYGFALRPPNRMSA
jgi:hypothetical protein